MTIKDTRIRSRAGLSSIRPAARIALVFCGLTVCAFGQAADSPNLVPNGDFSAVTAGKPDNWAAIGNPNDVALALNAAKDEHGKPCAQLVCTRCDHASLVTLRQAGGTTLQANRVYELSCRMRAENLRSGTVDIAFQGTQGWLFGTFTQRADVSRSWQQYWLPLRPERDAGATGRVEFRIVETGKLWVSDVRIYELPAPDVEFTETVSDVGARNLLVNGSFGLGASHWSSLGVSRSTWGGLSELHGTVQTSGGADGRAFLRIPLGGERTPLVCFDYYLPVVRREIRPLAANLGWIPVEKGTPYTLSCDMRASKEGVRAMLAAHSEAPDAGASDYSKDVTLTTQWQRYSFTFKPEQRYAFVMVGPDLVEEDRVDVDVGAVQLEKGDQATAWTPRTPVEFAIEPSQPAGIFTEGEPASLILCAANYSEAAVQAPVRLSVTDFDDKPVAVPELSLSIPPRSAVRSEWKLPADWKGYYRIHGRLELRGQPDLADLRIAVVPKRTSNDSVCGINHAFTTDRLIQLASKAGATWYRDWSLRWQSIEPAKGEFHWEVGDAQIDRVLREGCHVVTLLPPFPSADWSSEAPPEIATEGYPGMRLRQGWAPRDPNDLANYVEKSVEHYKDRIHVYEFLNEPLFTNYALPEDAGDRFGGEKEYGVADYVALLAAASRAMKKADPSCKIIAGMSSGPGGFRNNEIIQAGCLKYADYFNIHIYPGGRPPERLIQQMDSMLAYMDAHGGRKPIWLTEFSYYAGDELPRKPSTGGQDPWAGATLLPNERQCAQLTVRFFAVMLSHGVEKIFFHSGASGIANGPQFDCAFLGYGGAPRRLFPALAVLTELLGDKPASSGYRRLGNAGHAAAFEAGRQAVLILWEGENGPNSALSGIPESVRCFDMMGREIAARPVKLSPSPVYLLGAPGQAKELLDSLQIVPAGGG